MHKLGDVAFPQMCDECIVWNSQVARYLLTMYWVAAERNKQNHVLEENMNIYWSWDLIYISGFQMKDEINGLNQEL